MTFRFPVLVSRHGKLNVYLRFTAYFEVIPYTITGMCTIRGAHGHAGIWETGRYYAVVLNIRVFGQNVKRKDTVYSPDSLYYGEYSVRRFSVF